MGNGVDHCLRRGFHCLYRVGNDVLYRIGNRTLYHVPGGLQALAAGVDEVDRVILDVGIAVQAAGIGYAAPDNVLLAEAVHLRLIEPGTEVDHAGGGVVILAVVAEAADGLTYLLAEGGVALGGDRFLRQCTAQSVPGVVIADLCRHGAPAIVDVLGLTVACLCGNPLQAVGIVGFNTVGVGRNHHAVAHEDVPGERCRSFGVGYCVQQAIGVVGIGLAVLTVRPALEQVQGVAGVTMTPGPPSIR